MTIRAFSYGGGVQSTAALVLAARGKIDFKTFLFCNVGDDSENPETLTYIQQYARPYAEAHGIELIELQKTWIKGERAGQPVTLYGNLMRDGKSIGIPVRLGSGAPGNRSCTVDFKIRVVDRWLKEHGAREKGAIVGLGISLDEWQRMKTAVDPETPWKRTAYPLIDARIDRAQCIAIIQRSGLPVPPKSSCYFCPYHRLSTWQEMRRNQPDLFEKACDLEERLRERAQSLGRGDIWFTDKLKPLKQATTALYQDSLFEDDTCESGYCMI